MDLTQSFDIIDDEWQLDDGQQVRYELDDDEIEHARTWARIRHESYASGETTDEDWAGDSLGSMARGVAVELVMALLYTECEFDTYVGADGDGGVDGQLPIDGDVLDVDVKSTRIDETDVPYDVELLVAKHHLDERDVPPVFVGAYVADDMSEVRLRGFVHTEDLVDEAEIKDAYAGSHQNYALDPDHMEPMPEPTEDLDEHDGAEIVWI